MGGTSWKAPTYAPRSATLARLPYVMDCPAYRWDGRRGGPGVEHGGKFSVIELGKEKLLVQAHDIPARS